MLTRLQFQIERLGIWWCGMHHQSLRWPVHGAYECATCFRRYPVPWAEHTQYPTRTLQTVSGDHPSVTIWAPPRHDSGCKLPVF